MPLRIRCPQCRTIQLVPAGVRPICPNCQFAGNSAAQGAAGASAAAADTEGAWAKPDDQNVVWDPAPGERTAANAGTEPTVAWARAPADTGAPASTTETKPVKFTRTN